VVFRSEKRAEAFGWESKLFKASEGQKTAIPAALNKNQMWSIVASYVGRDGIIGSSGLRTITGLVLRPAEIFGFRIQLRIVIRSGGPQGTQLGKGMILAKTFIPSVRPGIGKEDSLTNLPG